GGGASPEMTDGFHAGAVHEDTFDERVGEQLAGDFEGDVAVASDHADLTGGDRAMPERFVGEQQDPFDAPRLGGGVAAYDTGEGVGQIAVVRLVSALAERSAVLDIGFGLETVHEPGA